MEAPIPAVPEIVLDNLSAEKACSGGSGRWCWRLGKRCLVALVAFLVVGNLAIFLTHVWAARYSSPGVAIAAIDGIDHLVAVDGKVWRGGHPSLASYEELAARGVTTVVDLRAEDDAADGDAAIRAIGLEVVHLPIRDGQIPSDAEIASFLDIVSGSDGTVFLHCGAGVGRTGAMAAAYLVATGQASSSQALRRNLAIGPPSLEQIAFVAGLSGSDGDKPGPIITGMSRVLDAPRRILLGL